MDKAEEQRTEDDNKQYSTEQMKERRPQNIDNVIEKLRDINFPFLRGETSARNLAFVLFELDEIEASLKKYRKEVTVEHKKKRALYDQQFDKFLKDLKKPHDNKK